MQLNILLDQDSQEQAKLLRAAYYPGKSSRQVRDSYIFGHCVMDYDDDFKALETYIANELPCSTSQRMLSISQQAYDRIREIATTLGTSMAATFRAIIAYSVEHINSDTDSEPKAQDRNSAEMAETLLAKLSILETKSIELTQGIAEIKALLYLL